MKSEIERNIDHLCKTVQGSLSIDDDCLKAVDEMLNAILEADKIFLYGVGRSGLVAKAFAIRLVQLGLDVFFVGESNTPMVKSNAVAIIISNTGQTMSAVQTANIVRRIGARAIAITSDPHSKLSHAASTNIIIANRVPEREEKAHLTPMGTVFEEATALLLDGLVPILMTRLGETNDSMRKRHAIWV